MRSEECSAKKSRKWHSMSRNNRILIIIVCIFLSVVLVFGAGFGIYFAVEEANTVVKIGNVRMDEGVVRVLASYHKHRYLKDLYQAGYHTARDTEDFWNQISPGTEKTQGELYLSSLKSYISGIAVSADLYFSQNRLTESDKSYIKDKTQSFISYYGSIEKFNEKGKEYGFDYDDFYRAMELSYTANLAFYSIYGSEGEALKSNEYSLRCDEYLEGYTRVKLIFIARNEIFDKELNDWRELNAEEVLQRENKISIFKEAISDGSMPEETFDAYLGDTSSLHDGDSKMGINGYYFKRGTEQTERFEYQEIVNAAFDMQIGEVRAVDCDGGVAFLYRADVVSGAYTDDENPFFSDFYKMAAEEFFIEDRDLLESEVIFKESYYEINLLSIPANENFLNSWE